MFDKGKVKTEHNGYGSVRLEFEGLSIIISFRDSGKLQITSLMLTDVYLGNSNLKHAISDSSIFLQLDRSKPNTEKVD